MIGDPRFVDECWSAASSAVDTVPVRSAEATADWNLLVDELLRIRQFEDDWDGEGTFAPLPSLVDGAIKLAQKLAATGCPPADRVLASVNGTVCFEWRSALGYGEIEVTSPLEAEGRWVQAGAQRAEVTQFTLGS